MNVEEIEKQLELTMERLQDVAEQLTMAESNGYTEKDTEWMDLVIEAQALLGFKSEFERILSERYAQQEQTNQVINNEPPGSEQLELNNNHTEQIFEQDENTPFYSFIEYLEERKQTKCEY
jgi:hypothetical protein